MSALTTWGNGSGFIYVVATNGTDILQNLTNTQNNVKKVLLDASTSVGLSGNAGTYDSNYGKRYFLNASGSAGSLSGATEITGFIVQRGLESTLPIQLAILDPGTSTLSPVRSASISIINIQGDPDFGAAELHTITNTNYNSGDIIILQNIQNPGNPTTTIKDSTGNIELANATDFVTGDLSNKIMLQYNSADTTWYELSRTPNPALSVANMRAAGIPIPIAGVNKTTLVNGGGTINIEPGVDKGIQVYDGSPSLAGSYAIQIQGSPTTPYLDGDTMFVEYRALTTVNSSTVTIFGIQLTTTQALQGRVYLKAEYKLSNTTWYYDIFYDAHGVDVENRAYTTATYEPKLGNPAGNGYILSSSTGGVRSWIPNPGGTNLWEAGGGAGSIQTLGNGADAAGDNSFAAGQNTQAVLNAVALGNTAISDGEGGVAIGSSARNNDTGGVAIGYQALAFTTFGTAIGYQANAHGADSNALGYKAKALIDDTTNISGVIITRRDDSTISGSEVKFGAGAIATITTEEIDLTAIADFQITIPSGALFYPDEVDLILTTIGGTVTAQPFIRAGKSGTLAFYLAIVQTTALTATLGNRERKATLLTNAGSQTITASVTTGATGSSTIKGRFVFRGLLVENQ